MASKNFLIKKGLTVGDSDLHVSNNRASVKNLTVGNVEFPADIGTQDQILRVDGGIVSFGNLTSDLVIGNAGFDSDQIKSILTENHAKVDSDAIVSLVNDNVSQGNIVDANGSLGFDSDQIVSIINENAVQAISPSITTTIENYKFICTAGQTSFSGNDSNGASLSYTVNSIQVFLNGIKLDSTDFTATNGTSVTLTEPTQENAELLVDAFKIIFS